MLTTLQKQWDIIIQWLFSNSWEPAKQTWYISLKKPFWNPPNYVFRPVWTILYLMIAGAGIHIFFRLTPSPITNKIRKWFLIQIICNLFWSFLFFSAQAIYLSLFDCIVIWVANLQTIRLLYTEDPVIAYLLMPYQAWISFACILNGAICFLNYK